MRISGVKGPRKAHDGSGRDFAMIAQARLSATPDLPYHPGPVTSVIDLSLDELRFLRSCHQQWYELSPAEASAIIKAARKLIVDLIHGHDLLNSKMRHHER
jgi:hypothetical protein